jgi:hypothetical protein
VEKFRDLYICDAIPASEFEDGTAIGRINSDRADILWGNCTRGPTQVRSPKKEKSAGSLLIRSIAVPP